MHCDREVITVYTEYEYHEQRLGFQVNIDSIQDSTFASHPDDPGSVSGVCNFF